MDLRRTTGCALAVLAPALGTAACGGGRERVNRDRPPASITVTAAIIDGRVLVSPRRFGAGPIRLVVTNQTGVAQAVTIETEDVRSAPGIRRSTPSISPSGTATLEVDVERGRYAVHTADKAVEPATVRVGPRRASAQDELLQP